MKPDVYDVSVLMAICRYDEHTDLAIDSILRQVGVLVQLVIVVNGARREEILQVLRAKYNFYNVKIVECEIAQLSSSLNYGVGFCHSNYVARMDSDDISSPFRLQKQLSYMADNGFDILGCDIDLIGADGHYIGRRHYPSKEEISKFIFHSNPFCHPSVVMKKSILLDARGYNSGFASEDYELWIRIFNRMRDISWGNLNESLLSYRIHETDTQGNPLAYAEIAGVFLREFLVSFKAKLLLGMFVFVLKSLWRRIK
ncbi:MAG: glycosyltransferase [Plesiomonas shigelloides]